MTAELPQATNPQHQDLVQLNLNSSGGCNDGHPRVFVVGRSQCRVCLGDDPYGYPFCPVCDYCCGC